jgi:hypothetical protein
MEGLYTKMKDLLGFTEKLSEATEETKMATETTLADGTTIMTDSDAFEVGSLVFVKGDDDERMALPSGSYELSDGSKIEVVDGEVTGMGSDEAVEEEEELSAEEVVEEATEEVEASKEEETKEIDLSNYMTKADGLELGKLITEAIELQLNEKLEELTQAQNNKIEDVKKMSAQKNFKHTPKAPAKAVEVKQAMSQDDRIFAIFNKAKNK